MNFTLDDDASQIVYSAGWGVQSLNSADLDEYFERTYHVAEQDGATVNLTFSGSAIAVFGSIGPGHADYTVQFDDTVLPNQSAYATTTQFQQVLFQRDFSSANVADTHFVSLKVIFTGKGHWLDIDFLTFTDGNITNGVTTTAAVATVTPPYLSTASSAPSSGSTTPSTASNVGISTSKSPAVSTILAGVFGGILGVVLILLGIWLLLRLLYTRKRRREHAFRVGAPPPNTPKSTAFSEAISGPRGARTGTAMATNYRGGESVASFSLHNPFGTGSRDPSASQVNLEMSGASLTSMNVGLGHSTSGSGSGVSSNIFADPRGYAAVPSHTPPPTLPLMAPDAPLVPIRAGTPVGGGGERKAGLPVKGPGVREFLTGSPVLWAGAKHRGDADSLRTDFLQV